MKTTITNGVYPRVSRSYVSFQIAMLITFLRNIIALMTGNPKFPTPSPDLATMTAAVTDLAAKTETALNGGRLEIAARRAATASTLSLARQLGNYVESTANGDLEVLLSSGFDPIKAPSPSVVPGTPGNPRLEYTGLTGQLLFRFDGASNVRNYSVQYGESADGPFTDFGLSSGTRVLLEDLTPGKVYWVRACANGAAGTSDWCAPTSMMAV